MAIIKNCAVTQSDAEILKGFGITHTGLDIKAKEVYSVSTGVVLLRNFDTNKKEYSVAISLLNSNCLFNYAHLKTLNVVKGNYIQKGTLLGTVTSYVHVDFADTSWSLYPFRTDGKTTYYKHDPSGKLDGQYYPGSNYLKDLATWQKNRMDISVQDVIDMDGVSNSFLKECVSNYDKVEDISYLRNKGYLQ